VANKFYTPGEERAQKVQELFSAIAHRYDLINDLQSFGLHRYWKRRMLSLAGLRPGAKALDLCCGTGDIALGMARAGANAIGLDFSHRMLMEAQRRAKSAMRQTEVAGQTNSLPLNPPLHPSQEGNLQQAPQTKLPSSEGLGVGSGRQCAIKVRGNLSLVQADALHIPFRSEQFDVVTISYGLRNLADFRAGLGEMWRILKPGGRMLVLDFGKPDNALWRTCYFTYLRWLVPLFGRIFCGDPQTYAYILESLQNYPAHKGVIAAMEEMRCQQIQTVHFLGGVMTINCGVKR
jgi:demethylmenaquinone methyltransferase/2-methoxy-6-polyprenyl-1,4-benzoquinol methylase